MALVTWIKQNKLAFALSLAAIYVLIQNQLPHLFGSSRLSETSSAPMLAMTEPAPMGLAADRVSKNTILPEADYAPSDSQNRLILLDTTISLVVADVGETINSVLSLAQDNGGFLVNSNLSNPEGAASGTITIRVPETKRQSLLSAIKALGLKTVSEYISGRDVTDEYVDLEARLSTLNQTKAKFEQILNSAINIQDLLEVQRELINLQSQIDSLKGRQQYLEQSAQLAKITIYLSTDEFSLPYTPTETWRPEVIFKQAVRSMITSLRRLGTALIWMVVYLPVWGPILAGYWLYRRRHQN